MPARSSNLCTVFGNHQPAFRELGLDVDTIFSHKLIQPWRTLPGDRDNSLLSTTLANGQTIRWHVKRYVAPERAKLEVTGYELLITNQIPTAPLVAWGVHQDRRSFIISENLADFEAGDKLIASGVSFDDVLEATADLAAKLHNSNLHHRDMYICHFFIRRNQPTDVKLIDVARVASFQNSLFKRRWIVKDLAQFWYSTLSLPISEKQRDAWLERYASQRQIRAALLRSAIVRKSNWIARHDRQLRKAQPTRNVSLKD